MEIDRRAFVSSLGGAAAVALLVLDGGGVVGVTRQRANPTIVCRIGAPQQLRLRLGIAPAAEFSPGVGRVQPFLVRMK